MARASHQEIKLSWQREGIVKPIADPDAGSSWEVPSSRWNPETDRSFLNALYWEGWEKFDHLTEICGQRRNRNDILSRNCIDPETGLAFEGD